MRKNLRVLRIQKYLFLRNIFKLLKLQFLIIFCYSVTLLLKIREREKRKVVGKYYSLYIGSWKCRVTRNSVTSPLFSTLNRYAVTRLGSQPPLIHKIKAKILDTYCEI